MAAIFCAVGLAQQSGFEKAKVRQLRDAVRGAFLAGDQVYAWGEEIHVIRTRDLKTQTFGLLRPIGPGGCVTDVNGDGKPDVIALEKSETGPLGNMVWLEAPTFTSQLIDTHAEFEDCLPATLFGKRGVLVIHRYSQVRFYEIPARPREKWPYRELYSIYTPSAQGGLAMGDVDKDGRPDILVGNYWLKSPAEADAAWYLFPINRWWDGPRAAMLRVAYAAPLALAAEREKSPAKVAWFAPPSSPGPLWTEAPLNVTPPIRKPEALTVADLNGNGQMDAVLGENAGDDSRLLVFWALEDKRYQAAQIDVTEGLLGIWAVKVEGEVRPALIGVGPRTALLWKPQRRK
ncbi:MAG: hypothetical protein IT168_08655 [Bryobacterales bacterium]|nr:hypothetical protein [Bryobacterales bacterium]